MSIGISLHIGLNRVDSNHYGSEYQLIAPEKDASDMQFICDNVKPAFQSSQLLIGPNATKAKVISFIEEASYILGENDIFVITYSGHGGLLPNLNGDDEMSGKDQTWCLYDKMLIDDELSKLWIKFKKCARILIISDSCHSGTILKSLGNKKVPNNNGYYPKYIENSILDRIYHQNKEYYYEKLIEPKTKIADIMAKVISLSACLDTQFAYDGKTNSVFTNCLKKIWNSGDFNGNYEDFLIEISYNLHNNKSEQNPNFETINDQDKGFTNQKPFKI